MKKGLRNLLVLSFIVMIVLSLSGCDGASYTMTGTGSKTTIKVSAEDGKYGEGFVMDISKKEIISIDSQLEEGELQIDFLEVMNTATGDEPDDYETLSTIKTVNIKPGDHLEFALDYVGEFMPGLTAIGKTSGTIIISKIKQ